MKLCDVVSLIEKRMPLTWSEEWDNSGLLVGDPDSDIVKAGIALDVTEETVLKATRSGCQLLVTHHPIIFRPLKNIIPDRPAGKSMVTAIKMASHCMLRTPTGIHHRKVSILRLQNCLDLMRSNLSFRLLTGLRHGEWEQSESS